MSATAPTSSVARWLRIKALLVVAVGGAVLFGGWLMGYESLIHLGVAQAATVPSTALLFLLAGTALAWHQGSFGTEFSRTLTARLAGIIIALLAAGDLLATYAGLATGIDALLWPHIPEFQIYAMAPATAFCFLLAAYCLMDLTRETANRHWSYVTSATLGLLACSVALVGYAFDARALYAVSLFSAMALPTAITFALLFSALLLARAEDGWVGILLARDGGGRTARRLLPVVVLGPLVLGLLTLGATEAGLFDANFRLSLLAITLLMVGAAAVVRNAHLQNQAERQVNAAMAELQIALNDRDLLLREVHHRVKNNLQQINALIFFESANIEDEAAKASFRATSGRIQALALVHNLLIAGPAPSKVDLARFVHDLCNNTAAGLGTEQRGVTVRVDVPEGVVDIDIAVTLGLLINEVLVNAIKHGYADGRTGTITVTMRPTGNGGAVLSIQDDGVGAGHGPSQPTAGGGVGSRIIRTLSRQLGATVETLVTDGTEIRITLPPGFRKGDTDGD